MKNKAIYEKTKVETDLIKVAANSAIFEGRIYTDIVDPNGEVYWYIRFNTKLDEKTVSKYTMNITQIDGYIINSIITYDKTRNLIVLCPMDLYRQNEYYFLNISKKVCSEKGIHLKKPVHILFKLFKNEISEFSILKNSKNIPKPRKKPKKIKMIENAQYMLARAYEGDISSRKLPQAPLELNIIPVFFGLTIMILSLIVRQPVFIAISISIAIIGIMHFFLQLRNKKIKFQINYFLGSINFDKRKYIKAEKYFEKARSFDKNNQLADLAIKKCKYFVNNT